MLNSYCIYSTFCFVAPVTYFLTGLTVVFSSLWLFYRRMWSHAFYSLLLPTYLSAVRSVRNLSGQMSCPSSGQLCLSFNMCLPDTGLLLIGRKSPHGEKIQNIWQRRPPHFSSCSLLAMGLFLSLNLHYRFYFLLLLIDVLFVFLNH